MLLALVLFGLPLGAAAQAKPADVDLGGVKIEFAAIPAGEFDMGCSPGDPDCEDVESPRHRVRISKPFEIGKYEVTQEQWRAVMGPSHRSGYPVSPKAPVENLAWGETQPFVEKLNARKDGYRYRLPTEAEWEYAARAGSADMHIGGKLPAIGWFLDNAFAHWGAVEVQPVGRKLPNAWGLYDMLGNVWEWCQDWFAPDYYAKSPPVDPQGPPSGTMGRTCRGGAWNCLTKHLRASRRGRHRETSWEATLGFRIVRQPVK